MKSFIALITLVILNFTAMAAVKKNAHETVKEGEVLENKIMDFEASSVPSRFVEGPHSKLKISSEFSQYGQQALEWSWDQPSYIDIDLRDILNDEKIISAFISWIYNFDSKGSIELQWGKRKDIEAQNSDVRKRPFLLNFKHSWRGMWVYTDNDDPRQGEGDPIRLLGGTTIDNEDLSEFPTVEMVRLKSSSKKGKLLFDLMQIGKYFFPHGRIGSDQMPWVINSDDRHNYPWNARSYTYKNRQLPKATEENLKAFDAIEKRFQEIYGSKFSRLSRYYKFEREFYAKTEMRDDKILGPAITPYTVNQYYKLRGYELLENRSVFSALAVSADKFKKTKDVKWHHRYIKILNYMHEKGLSDGSSLMNQVFIAKNAHAYRESLTLMKDHLPKDVLQREVNTLAWISGYGHLYAPEAKPVDADKMLGDLVTMLYAIHLQPSDTHEQKMKKLYDYTKFGKIVNATIAPGVPTQTRKRIVFPDHSVFHHGQEMMFSYGYAAVERYFGYYYILHGTSAAMDETVAKAFVNLYPNFFTPGGAGPTTGGRDASAANARGYFNSLILAARSGLADGKSWHKYFQQQGALKPMTDLDMQGVSMPAVTKGTYSQPFGAMISHRHSDWMVFLRGMSFFTPSPEMFSLPKRHNAANVYGDQQGYGFLQIIKNDGAKKSGIELNSPGWDWSMYPGATTGRIPLEVLRDQMIDGKFGSDQPNLNGGLSHFGKSGLYFLELEGQRSPDFPLHQLSGYKSWFMFDDKIICLGSDIKNVDKDVAMVTNVLQFYHGKDLNKGFHIHDGHETKAYDTAIQEKNLGLSQATVLGPDQNVYFIPDASTLKLSQGTQISATHTKSSKYKRTQGAYSKLWFDHGIAPSAGHYEYAILVDGGKKDLETFYHNDLYKVLQKDSKAHIIKYTPTDSYGYAFIQAAKDNQHGIIQSTSRPVLAMSSSHEHNVQLTLTDPNVNVHCSHHINNDLVGHGDELLNEHEHAIKHKVTLRGRWTVSCEQASTVFNATIHGDQTIISFESLYGRSNDFRLTQTSTSIH